MRIRKGDRSLVRWLVITFGATLLLSGLGLSLFYVGEGQRGVVLNSSNFESRDADPSTEDFDVFGPGLHFSVPFREQVAIYALSEEALAVAEATATESITESVGEESGSPTREEVATETAQPIATLEGGGFGELAFASDRSGSFQIYSLILGSAAEPQMLTDMSGGACQPAWSPDGRQLIFVSPCSQNRDSYPGSTLFIVDSDRGEVRALLADAGGDYDPAWSPDGESVVFTSLRENNRPQVHRFNMTSGDMVNLSKSSSPEFMPSWSPDGSQIVFVSTGAGPYQLWTMDANGGAKAFFSRSDNRRNSDPDWSPDGQKILFVQSPLSGGLPSGLEASWADGGSERGRDEQVAVASTMPMRGVVYSTDGNWIVFSSNPDGANHDLYMAALNSGEIIQLTFDESAEIDPSWR
jgi:Tol biopolymer transport system component